MKRKIFFIILFLIIVIQFQVFALDVPDDYIVQFKANISGIYNKVFEYTFDEPVDIRSVYFFYNGPTLGYDSFPPLRFYDSNGNLLLSTSIGTSNINTFIDIYVNDVKKILYTMHWNQATTYNFYDYSLGSLTLKDTLFDDSTQEIKYTFNKNVTVLKSDIVFKDKLNNDIPFDFYLNGNEVIIKPKSRITNGEYKTTLIEVSAGEQNLNFLDFNFTVEEPLSFMEIIVDKINNAISYVFNKDISALKEDISITDEFGNEQDFDFTIEDNILKIFPYAKIEGRYKVQPKRVFSLDGTEYLDNIPVYNFEITGITLIHKNFGNYISSDLRNLILTFDRNIQSAGITLRNNTDDSVIESQLIINGEKLIIDYESFTENTSYTLTIDNLNALDGNTLRNPLVFNFRTVKTTGNGGIDTIISEFLNIFTEAQNRGIKIVVLAIGIGIIFILSRWLWHKTKLWLKKS